jgi:hypothetical protein
MVSTPSRPSDPDLIDSEIIAPQMSEDVRQLIQWIESHPEYSALVEQARQDHRVNPQSSRPQLVQQQWRKGVDWAKGQVFARGDELYGNAIVTPKVKDDANVTARVATGANLLNFVGIMPVLLFSFKSVPLLGAPLALVSALLLLKFSNDTAAAVARGARGCKTWAASAAIFGFIPLSLIQSLVSGISTELFNNQSSLIQYRAKELVEQRFVGEDKQLASLKVLSSPAYLAAQRQCNTGQAELQRLPKTDPRWNSLQVRLYGSYNERNKDWSSLPLNMLPVCERVERLEQENQVKVDAAETRLQGLRASQIRLGNDVMFLKGNVPSVYQQHFQAQAGSSEEEFRSGAEAVAVAAEHFFTNLAQGRWNQLGLSLFFFSLSIITSTAACVMVIYFGRREDVQMSWSDEIRQERDRWLNQQFVELLEYQEFEQKQ